MYSPYCIKEDSNSNLNTLILQTVEQLTKDGLVHKEHLEESVGLLAPPMYAFAGKTLKALRGN